jgi:hypothetical protein
VTAGEPAAVGQTPQVSQTKKGGSATASEPAPVGPRTDKIGIELTPDQLPYFDGADKMRQFVEQLKERNKAVAPLALQPGCEHFRASCKHAGRNGKTKHSSNEIEDAIRRIENCMPYAGVCPYCHDKRPGSIDPHCNACKGLPYVTKGVFDRAPDDMKAKVLKLAKEAGRAAASEPEPEPTEPRTDEIGVELKPDQLAAFASLDLSGRLVELLKECNKMVHNLTTQSGGEMLRSKCKLVVKNEWEIFSLHDITNAIRLVEDQAPYAGICPYCHDKHPGKRDPHCTACEGHPYCRKHTFENAPEEMKDKVLKLATRPEETPNEAA